MKTAFPWEISPQTKANEATMAAFPDTNLDGKVSSNGRSFPRATVESPSRKEKFLARLFS